MLSSNSKTCIACDDNPMVSRLSLRARRTAINLFQTCFFVQLAVHPAAVNAEEPDGGLSTPIPVPEAQHPESSTSAQLATEIVVNPSPLLKGPFYNPLRAENWQVGFQSTYVWQNKLSLPAAYSGPNSLLTGAEAGYTMTATLSVGLRPWIGAEVFVNPEVIQSEELSQLHGLAGLSNGENQKTGGPLPNLYPARFFFRQTIPLGGDSASVSPSANQFSGTVASRRLVVTLGYLAMTDIFDGNSFSHDPRTQFMNWSLWTFGAADYAADSRGYTWGLAVEYYHDAWALRIARFAQPKESNGLPLDFHIIDHYGDNLEIEHDHVVLGRPGKVRLLGFHNRARMGNFRDAIAYAHVNSAFLSVGSVRKDQSKFGFGVGLEQNLIRDAGLFVRFSYNDGRTETYAYAEIEQSLALGGVVKGRLWRRPDDTFGLALVANGLSRAHRDYLAAGGLGFFIGDGQLNYGLEKIAEAFYSARLFTNLWFSLDGQYIVNPAYNKDRGPAKILGCRFHVEF
jgi:high affinity Mn2+ porin